MTLREAITAAATQLAANEHLRPNATRDAKLLLLHQLGITRSQFFADPDRLLTEQEAALYRKNIHRRAAAAEPIQYITGHQEFYGIDFHVTPAVLIPRPETEHLVEAVLQNLPPNEPLHILDIGTGSGILAVTLALHLPQAELTAVDISPEALSIAQQNAETHRVSHRIRFLESDLLASIPHEEKSFDAIVSNPPYIPEADRPTLHPQVRDHEPHTALFAGPTGLDIYRRLIPQAWSALKPDGLLALEIGYGQREAIAALLAGWQNISFLDDLQQIPRAVLARRPATTATPE